MSDPGPVRAQSDLSDVVELVLDKGVVVNADIVVTVGDTELLGVRVRAAIASFDTAAEYGLEFPAGTDQRRLERASGRPPITTEGGVDRGSDPYISARPVSDGEETGNDGTGRGSDPYISVRPTSDSGGAEDDGSRSSEREANDAGEAENVADADAEAPSGGDDDAD
ncbi:gas vesicle protein [Salinigranum rubrum]|uniref:Gas vesicle protein n=1 Tax=Salinigranum rubrum TaxID=755307 RepID=A0A2I8VKJ4_9EURY|nr:gas vesicle protein [Salinigranum rubrum]